MKFAAGLLLLILVGLQYRLWLSDDGIRSVLNLRDSVAAQTAENETLSRRNDQLAAEVKDLKEGLAALEERARTDLGMVGANETFFQVVENPTPAGTAPAAPAATPPVQRTSR
jgi:cell division protein FtsB